LEGSWEAFEDAGIDPHSLHGSQTGVFVGIGTSPYGSAAASSAADGEGYRLTGSFASVASGRIAYTFGLEGPAISIDTACSSSLVALHLACASLRAGECSLALAGGVTVMAAPDAFAEFANQGALARDGRSKSFSAAADGTGWGEGVGVLLVERLSDARRAGHRVLALVRGSAVNQDGASNGLTAPNGPAQQRAIRRALAEAELSPAEVDAVEAHGTGTVLGDPIEAQALLATYGQARERPLWLGSIKSNIGHTQHAAGAAGVIKMVMALRHGLLPRTLHAEQPSAQIDWSAGAVSLLAENRSWERNGRPRRAGVSSFGVSGTNAHVILEEAPPVEQPPSRRDASGGSEPSVGGEAFVGGGASARGEASDGEGSPMLAWALSARGPQALRAQATQLHDYLLGEQESQPGDVAHALAGRAKLEDRAVVLGAEREQLLGGLASLTRGETAANVCQGVAGDGGGRLAFLFTGQGAQYAGMGAELYRAFPVFKEALDRLCAGLDSRLEHPLLDVMFAAEDDPLAPLLHETAFTQASLFALEVSIFRLLEDWGLRPDYLLGHSIGELAAALVAGVFSLEDACKLVAARGRLMGALPAGGAMIAVQAGEQEALDSLAGYKGRASLAAVNGPRSVVLSGDEEAMSELAAQWRERARKVKRLHVSHAFHSARMDAMLDDFAQVAREISYAPPRLALVSNLSGELADDALCTPEYWTAQVRETVRFADGVRRLAREGVSALMELGPGGVLSAMADECLREDPPAGREDDPAAVVSTLRAGSPEAASLLGAVGELWSHGTGVDWAAMLPRRSEGKAVALPTYPFQRQHYWLEPVPAPSPGQAHVPGEDRRLRVSWKPIVANTAAALTGRWLVILPGDLADDPWVARLLGMLAAGGGEVVSIELEESENARGWLGERLAMEGEGEPDGGRGRAGAGAPLGGVLSLLALSEECDRGFASVPRGLASTLALAQALEDVESQAPLWLITRGAVSVSPSEDLSAPIQAQTWGLGLTIALEYPQRWGGLADLPEALDERVGSMLLGALAGSSGEDQLAIRGSGVLARRLTPARSEVDVREGWTVPPGTILISGGTGGLGAHVARRLAGGGAEHLLLLSRRGPDAPGAELLQAELEALGSQVSIAACDVADGERLGELVGSLSGERQLSAVVHAAGAGTQGAIGSLGAEDLEYALAAKAQGALNLHTLTAPIELSAFVLFSSLAGTLGSGLQAPYAAANAYLDALAQQRHSQGLPATSIAWGPWEGEGMAGDPAVAESLRRHGLAPMAPALALEALSEAISGAQPVGVVADIDWETYAPLFTIARPRPLIEDLPQVRAALRGSGRESSALVADGLRERLLAIPAAERRQIVLDMVRTEVARVLGHASSQAIDGKRAFKDLGFDSLTAVELRTRLDRLTGLELPATLAFDYPSPIAVADHLLGELVRDGASGGSLEGELAALERTLAALSDPKQRAGASARLRVLLGRLEEEREVSANGRQDATAVLEQMQDASDEEMFELIDRQLGAVERAGVEDE